MAHLASNVVEIIMHRPVVKLSENGWPNARMTAKLQII
jgi:hypothetical protein